MERPEYVPPAWLTTPATPGRARPLSVPVSSLDATIDVTLWSPDDDDSDSVPLPLMVVHDGPEYDERAALTHYLAAGITAGWLPRLRAALLSPGVDRNQAPKRVSRKLAPPMSCGRSRLSSTGRTSSLSRPTG